MNLEKSLRILAYSNVNQKKSPVRLRNVEILISSQTKPTRRLIQFVTIEEVAA